MVNEFWGDSPNFCNATFKKKILKLQLIFMSKLNLNEFYRIEIKMGNQNLNR